jgi:hypothetical protein
VTRLLRALPFKMGAAHPLTFVTIPLALLGGAALASPLLPRRATRTSSTLTLCGD